MLSSNLRFETLQLHMGQDVDPTTGSRAVPQHIDDIKADFEQTFAKINIQVEDMA